MKGVASKTVRVVIDTNIVISALLFGGRLSQLRSAWQLELFVPLVSKVTVTEIIRVLAYPKFKLTLDEQEDLLSDYVLFCESIALPQELPQIPDCRDPYDMPFLLLASVGKADYLVTGDKDLLVLKDSFSCPIMTANEFLSELA